MKSLFLFAATLCLTLTAWGGPDLDDPKMLNKILSEALPFHKIQKRGSEGEELIYAPNSQTPYTGWVKEMHENGQVDLLGRVKDGEQDGIATFWYDNGQKEKEVNYVDGKKHGLATGWYWNGQKQSEANFKDGKKHGLATFWLENGQKVKEVNFKDGKLHGLATGWYENGQKQGEANYVDGVEVK